MLGLKVRSGRPDSKSPVWVRTGRTLKTWVRCTPNNYQERWSEKFLSFQERWYHLPYTLDLILIINCNNFYDTVTTLNDMTKIFHRLLCSYRRNSFSLRSQWNELKRSFNVLTVPSPVDLMALQWLFFDASFSKIFSCSVQNFPEMLIIHGPSVSFSLVGKLLQLYPSRKKASDLSQPSNYRLISLLRIAEEIFKSDQQGIRWLSWILAASVWHAMWLSPIKIDRWSPHRKGDPEAIENLRTNRKTVWRPSQKLKGVASTPLTGRELTLGWTNVWS